MSAEGGGEGVVSDRAFNKIADGLREAISAARGELEIVELRPDGSIAPLPQPEWWRSRSYTAQLPHAARVFKVVS